VDDDDGSAGGAPQRGRCGTLQGGGCGWAVPSTDASPVSGLGILSVLFGLLGIRRAGRRSRRGSGCESRV
jgi:hypothetical protein